MNILVGGRSGGGWGRPGVAGGRPGAAGGRLGGGRRMAGDGRGAAGGWPGAAGGGREAREANIYKISAGAGSPRAFIRYFMAVFNGRVVKSRGLSLKRWFGRDPKINTLFAT